jgi:putative hemolysin
MKTLADIDLATLFPDASDLPRVNGVAEGRYVAKMVDNSEEFSAVLGLRSNVFKRELLSRSDSDGFSADLDLDGYDLHCEHLIVTDIESGDAVGTYRLNTLERAGAPEGLYASEEFSIEDLPGRVLERSVELGRACISREHRNSRVLFLLWKMLANYLVVRKKQYLFGCCSIFTQDGEKAAKVLEQLRRDGHMHPELTVRPRVEKRIVPVGFDPSGLDLVQLPMLVNIYLRIGAMVCGEPAIDREMKTVDFFVVFDLDRINPKYRKMFFGDLL